MNNTTNRNCFVVRLHHAERAGTHHDLQLGTDDTFLSWAVPKLVPRTLGVRVLAIRTAEHDSEQARFEGVIPKGQYGAGESKIIDEGELTMISHSPNHYFFQLRGNAFSGNYYMRHWRNNHWLLWKRT